MASNNDTFLHLARPLGPAPVGTQPSTHPLSVVIQPQALLSILDHSTRRPPDQSRVIGTLLGTRSDADDSTITIHSSFAVGHTETTDQVEVDMEYQKTMLDLHKKGNPKEVLVGWYATSSELNTFSALIQNFYGGQGEGTWPYPAVHMTVSTELGKDVEVRTYISAPVGVTAERAADSAAFIPVPYEIRYGEADRSGLELLSVAKDREDRSMPLITDIEGLERALEDILGMLDRVGKYVEGVIEEEDDTPPNTALGQYLLNALALAPKVEPADIEKDLYVPFQPNHPRIDADFFFSNNHIQDVLAVSYLANTIRTQMDLSNRLATAQLTMGGPETNAPASKEEGGQQNQRGGGQRGGRGRQGQQREPREQREPVSAV
jgi:translation initiation factor 3 subunit F